MIGRFTESIVVLALMAIITIVTLVIVALIYMGIFYLLLKISFIRRFAQKIIDRIEERENR